MAIVNSRAAIEPKTGKAAIFVNETIPSLMRKLFSNGEQGFAYDPNDLSTMYQDAAGTVPVTAVGQPIGLILDKKNPALVGGEVSVDITNWEVFGSINKVDKNTFSSAGNVNGVFYDGAAIDGLKVVELHYTVTGGTVQICDAVGSRIRAVSTEPSGVLKAIFYPDRSSSPLGRIYFRLPTAGTTLVIDELNVHTYTGNHAYQTTSASRPILRKNAVTGANYLEFDGTDDSLQTSSIDFTATDKVSLFAGIAKTVSGSTGSIFEFSSSPLINSGTFGAYTDITSSRAGVAVYSRGTVTASAPTDTIVMNLSLAMRASISQQMISSRINGNSTVSTTSQGDGNYGNYPLYIGRRAGTSLPFNGHIYSLIGVGKLVSDDETAAIEKELAKRVGVTLNV